MGEVDMENYTNLPEGAYQPEGHKMYSENNTPLEAAMPDGSDYGGGGT